MSRLEQDHGPELAEPPPFPTLNLAKWFAIAGAAITAGIVGMMFWRLAYPPQPEDPPPPAAVEVKPAEISPAQPRPAPSQRAETPVERAMAITAYELERDYSANEVKADL